MSADPATARRTADLTLAVIVPTLDEGPCIDAVLDGLFQVPGIDEVLVIDGGATGGTWERLNERLVARRPDDRPTLRIVAQSEPGFVPPGGLLPDPAGVLDAAPDRLGRPPGHEGPQGRPYLSHPRGQAKKAKRGLGYFAHFLCKVT